MATPSQSLGVMSSLVTNLSRQFRAEGEQMHGEESKTTPPRESFFLTYYNVNTRALTYPDGASLFAGTI